MNAPDPAQASEVAWNLPTRIGLAAEVERVREFIADWVAGCEPHMTELLEYQLSGPSKYFRPVTVFACHRATSDEAPGDDVVRVAAAAELFHNYTLVIDDIVDHDQFRRGKAALHYRFGRHPALMTGAFLAFSSARLVADDPGSTEVFTGLGRRIAIVERRQWRIRRQSLGIDVWRGLAGEDTGAMFESCARLGAGGEVLDRYGYLLGTLYHGCDDVADVRGSLALGAHSEQDIRDRIVTLPAAIATRDPDVARLFHDEDPAVEDELTEHLVAALPEAEKVLDEIAAEAEREAAVNARDSTALIELVRYTRTLSTA